MKRTIAISIIMLLALGLSTSCDDVGELTDHTFEGYFDGKEMTLDDVRELSAKGDSLIFEDFRRFQGANASSNLDNYIMVYSVEGGYRLVVRSKASGKPGSVKLESVWKSGGSGIDIRYNDVEAFLLATPSQPVITEQEALDIAQTYSGLSVELVSWEVLANESVRNSAKAIFAENLLNSMSRLPEPCYLFRSLYIRASSAYIAVGKKTGTVYYGVPSRTGIIYSWHVAESSSIETLDEAIKWYIFGRHPRRYLEGEYFVASYRILDSVKSPDRITVYAFIIVEWVSLDGEIVSGGTGIDEISFKKNNDVYEFEKDSPIDKSRFEDLIKYSRLIDNSLHAEIRAEIDKSIADFLISVQ